MALCESCGGEEIVAGQMQCSCEEGKNCAGDGTVPTTAERICAACSEKLQQCEICRSPLAEKT